jgi:3-oxoacyl-[acyl-carrier-protein] synthase-3
MRTPKIMNIKAISYYFPETYLDNETIALNNPEWSIEKIASKTGIYKRPIAPDGVLASDLAFMAAENLFIKYNIDKESVDFLLFCTQSPDYFLPTTACLLQEKLGLKTTTGALDFNLGCSGYIYGLSLAKGLICSNIASNVLLLTGETYSKFIHPKDKGSRTIFGDAASATIVSSEKGFCEIMNFCLGTDGRGAENLIIKNGALRNRATGEDDILESDGNFLRNNSYLYMNGSEIFKFATEAVPMLVRATLEKHDLRIADIDLFIFHQANKYILNFLRKILGIDENKFYINIANIGNTVSASIPIAIKNAIDDGKIKGNDKVLVAGFGVGYSYGATILKF